MTGDNDADIVHRELETEREEPAVQVAEIVADLKDTDARELSSIWSCIDHALDNVFSDPPAPEMQIEIPFNYEGFRITVEQDGAARFVELE